MRVSWNVNLVAGALAALVLVAGCGDGNDTNITIGDEATPTPGAPTPAKTPTAGVTTATPVDEATSTAGAATPTEAGGPTPTATMSPGGGVDADVQAITTGLLPFLTSTSLLTGGSVSSLTAGAAFGEAVQVEAVKNDPCPDGGTRVDDEGVPTRTITLTGCKVSQASLGHFQVDGTVVITLSSLTGGTIVFDVTSLDLDHNNHQVHFAGTLTLTVSLSGDFVLNGPLTIMTPEGNFTVQTNQITIDSNRHLVSGSGSISDDADNFDVDTVAMTVAQGGASATFTVTFDDTSVHHYSLNLTSGELTQTD